MAAVGTTNRFFEKKKNFCKLDRFCACAPIVCTMACDSVAKSVKSSGNSKIIKYQDSIHVHKVHFRGRVGPRGVIPFFVTLVTRVTRVTPHDSCDSL
jgi:hypothetical protein